MVYQQQLQLHQEQHFEFNISSFFQIPYPGKCKICCICWEIAKLSQRPSNSILTATRALETGEKTERKALDKFYGSQLFREAFHFPARLLLQFSRFQKERRRQVGLHGATLHLTCCTPTVVSSWLHWAGVKMNLFNIQN